MRQKEVHRSEVRHRTQQEDIKTRRLLRTKRLRVHEEHAYALVRRRTQATAEYLHRQQPVVYFCVGYSLHVRCSRVLTIIYLTFSSRLTAVLYCMHTKNTRNEWWACIAQIKGERKRGRDLSGVRQILRHYLRYTCTKFFNS